MKGKRIITDKYKNWWTSRGKILYSNPHILTNMLSKRDKLELKAVFNIISNILQRHHKAICFLTFLHLFSLQHSSQAKLSNCNSFELTAVFNIISNISQGPVHITMGFMCPILPATFF